MVRANEVEVVLFKFGKMPGTSELIAKEMRFLSASKRIAHKVSGENATGQKLLFTAKLFANRLNFDGNCAAVTIALQCSIGLKDRL
jgi:hypothetical protein